MKLFILRHGHAEPFAATDAERELSAQGELEVHRVCQNHYDAISQVEHVFCSPYLRAKQTADIARQYINAPISECKLIVPNGRPSDVIEFLYGKSEAYAKVLIVSHQPLVGTLVDDLCGAEAGRYRMGTASLAELNCAPLASGCCELEGLNHP